MTITHEPVKPIPGGDPYLALATEDPHGRAMKFSEFGGKVRLIDMWASWCGPCRMTVPELNDLYGRYKDKGLVVIGLSMDNDPVAVLDFQHEFPMRYPNGMFNPQLGAVLGEPTSIPTTLLVDRSGKLRSRFVGYIEAATIEEQIRKYL